MGIATGAQYFCSPHEQGIVCLLCDMFRDQGCVKAGPPSAGIKLRFGGKQLQPATNTGIDAGIVTGVVAVAKGTFRALFPGNIKLLIR
tara:strand:+ start:906 stop:1169 length:264 start_codon:yes stop_codon:yes gene_type:complete